MLGDILSQDYVFKSSRNRGTIENNDLFGASTGYSTKVSQRFHSTNARDDKVVTAAHANRSSCPSLAALYEKFDHPLDQAIASLSEVLLSEEMTNEYFRWAQPLENIFTVRSEKHVHTEIARGCVIFLIFHRMATFPESHRDLNFINRLVADPDFLALFRSFYQIPTDWGLTSLAFHASGTTSFIFKALTKRHPAVALKVLQAPYVALPSLRASTAGYAATYGLHTKHSPHIHDSDALWILMDFVEGPNLSEYMGLLRASVPFLSDTYVSHIASIFHKVADALSYYERLHPPLIHGDLTPFNIIVETEALTPKGIKLIDFGPNYVLKDRIGSRRIFVEAFSRTELYTAPEVLTGQFDASLRSDLFSLGMIGLDLLCKEPLKKEAVGVRLREIWQNPASVGIAQIIEDLIDDNPEHRLLIMDKKSSLRVYHALDRVLQDQVALYKDLVVEGRRTIELKSHARRSFKPDVWQSLANVARILKSQDNPYNTATRLQLVASEMNAAFQALIVTAFVFYTAADIQVRYIPALNGAFQDTLVALIRLFPVHFQVGDVWGNLPGRAVALTFGLIAPRYYANIFAALAVAPVRVANRTLTNIVLRLNSFTYFVPIMTAIVYAPHWWPFCCLAGTLFPALNNFLCWRTARDAWRKSEKVFSVATFHDSETEHFLGMCREWAILMGLYSVGLGVIGVLLTTGLARDESVYATFVCGINMFKMYRNNCGREAPIVSGNLSRLFFSARRWGNLGDLGVH